MERSVKQIGQGLGLGTDTEPDEEADDVPGQGLEVEVGGRLR